MNTKQEANDITIRLADSKDIPTLVSFNLSLAEETENLKLDSEKITGGVQEILKNPQIGFYIVTESEGKLLGTTMLTSQFDCQANKVVFWIQSVFVDASQRKKGYFKGMFNYMKEYSKNQGSPYMKLYAEYNNEKAIATYQRLGMYITKEKLIQIDFCYGGKEVPEVLSEWAKALGEKEPKVEVEFARPEDVDFITGKTDFEVLIGGSDLGDFKEGVAKGIQLTENLVKIFVISKNQERLGFAVLFPEFSDWRNGFSYYLTHLCFNSKASNDDDIKESIRGILNKLKDWNIQSFRVLALPDNKRGEELFEKMGFCEAHMKVLQLDLSDN